MEDKGEWVFAMICEKERGILTVLKWRDFNSATEGEVYVQWKCGVGGSTYWYYLKMLKNKGLVSYGKTLDHKPLTITKKGLKELKMIA